MKQERLSFVSCGRLLEGTLRLPQPEAPAPCVVLCHGFGSYDDDIGGFVRLAELLARSGLASLRFSFSGSHPYRDLGTIRPAR
jgi:predicted dienelactone hydrolase